MHQRLGATVIYVTHDQVEAMTLTDRIVMLNKSAPIEFHNHPATLLVAGFIGSPKDEPPGLCRNPRTR
ncbi:hypothetical protein [Bradyrhizobium sp. USDA 4454]